ncbi:hypothetical protein AAGW05_16320 [Arthrobacter sp. LAPM80]|uniref:hypothetical protein n=1 Tax=Arthrobacter sp. LAPM80 TaxID=3141788 RepID=UPI00398B49B8
MSASIASSRAFQRRVGAMLHSLAEVVQLGANFGVVSAGPGSLECVYNREKFSDGSKREPNGFSRRI